MFDCTDVVRAKGNAAMAVANGTMARIAADRSTTVYNFHNTGIIERLITIPLLPYKPRLLTTKVQP